MVANWADTPAVAQAGDGTLVAHWREARGRESGTFDLIISQSVDGGRTWRRLTKANDDTTATEHGFATVVSDGSGALAVWLDGREIPDGGAMTLRVGPVSAKLVSAVLDARDPAEILAAAFGVQTLPASFLIDRAGNVSWSGTGAVLPDDPALEAAIKAAAAP